MYATPLLSEAERDARLLNIRAVVTDMDGVMTDGTVWAFETGEMVRNVGSKDAYAIQWAVRQGIRFAVLSGGTARGMEGRLKALGVKEIRMGVAYKLPVLAELAAGWGLAWDQVCYIGDDMPDIEALRTAGLGVAPADGAADARAAANWVTDAPGGRGCVREVLERLMKAQGIWYHTDAYHW